MEFSEVTGVTDATGAAVTRAVTLCSDYVKLPNRTD